MFQEVLAYYGVSRQGYHQAIQRRAYQAHRASLMVGLILQVRQIHPEVWDSKKSTNSLSPKK